MLAASGSAQMLNSAEAVTLVHRMAAAHDHQFVDRFGQGGIDGEDGGDVAQRSDRYQSDLFGCRPAASR